MEVEGVASCHCPKCDNDFEQEVTIEIEPMDYNDLD